MAGSSSSSEMYAVTAGATGGALSGLAVVGLPDLLSLTLMTSSTADGDMGTEEMGTPGAVPHGRGF